MKPLKPPAAEQAAQAEFLRLKRKAAKRRSDRERARTKRHKAKPPAVVRLPPPERALPLPDRRTWEPNAKAQWVDALCIWIVDGGSLSSFCRTFPDGPDRSTWLDWVRDDAIIAARYTQAREASADVLADECVIIADSVADAGQFDSARVNAARLAVDARKWVASKLKPKEYADRIEQVTSGSLTVQHVMTDDDRARALMAILTRQAVQGAQSLPDAQRLIAGQVIDVSPEPAKRQD